MAWLHVKDPLDPTAPFNLGGTYAVSRGTLRRVGPFLADSKKRLPPGSKKKCHRYKSWAEDVNFGDCLQLAGVGTPNRTLDEWGRESFTSGTVMLPFWTVRRNDSSSWFWHGKPKHTGSGVMCCSARPINWHGLKDGALNEFFLIHYFLYNVRVDPLVDPAMKYTNWSMNDM